MPCSLRINLVVWLGDDPNGSIRRRKEINAEDAESTEKYVEAYLGTKDCSIPIASLAVPSVVTQEADAGASFRMRSIVR
jgi:hypothetical protein